MRACSSSSIRMTVTGFFLIINEQRDIQINHHRQDNLADYTLHLVAASYMLISWIQAHVLENEERVLEHDEISDTLGLPIRLDDVWAERSHPPLIDRVRYPVAGRVAK